MDYTKEADEGLTKSDLGSGGSCNGEGGLCLDLGLDLQLKRDSTNPQP